MSGFRSNLWSRKLIAVKFNLFPPMDLVDTLVHFDISRNGTGKEASKEISFRGKWSWFQRSPVFHHDLSVLVSPRTSFHHEVPNRFLLNWRSENKKFRNKKVKKGRHFWLINSLCLQSFKIKYLSKTFIYSLIFNDLSKFFVCEL